MEHLDPTEVADTGILERAVGRFRDAGIVLPKFAELAEPGKIPDGIRARLFEIAPDDAHPLNLFRVHWYNGDDRRSRAEVPSHLVLPESLTGVPARIVVLLGDRFPMIAAHKVLAAYGCLAPRVVTGRFDPTAHRAVWPSTGNYCRGGVAISRIMGCRGVAVLPEGMSRERFEWLEGWVSDSSDIIRTPGTESNVKEIYDKCAELAKDPANVILNQFSEFGNHLVHYLCTGRALEHVFHELRRQRPALELRAFVSASGSAGTLGAGDHLKEQFGARVVAVEALECPTMLYNGFGEHNIQGIGDKHIPYIHNVMNSDMVTAVSDRATDALNVVFNSDAGRGFLSKRREVPEEIVSGFDSLGISSICNVLASVKVARYMGLGDEDVVMTVATDGAAMYGSERDRTSVRDFPDGIDEMSAGTAFAEHMLGIGVDHLLELSAVDRQRIFNLGYFTWVEQQGVPLEDFLTRSDQSFWRRLHDLLPAWDGMIEEFNARAGVFEGS
jgi:cysteine synthase A